MGSLPAYAVNVVITGPTTVCPLNATPHTFTAKSYTLGVERTCTYNWGVFKNGVLLEERTGSTFSYTFEDIGNYQITVYTTWCQYGGSGISSITVNSRVKMPNSITGPTICNTGQAYSFTSTPSLFSQNDQDPDCYYHFSYLWTAPSGWNINGGGNTAFTSNTVNITAPVSTPPGSYTISVQSSIPYGGSPVQSNSWFSTPRTYTVQVGPFNTLQTTVSGTVAVCGGNTYTYTANVPGGHKSGYTYNWTYPTGWVVQYTSANTIQLYVPTTYSSYGTVRVSVNNGCGSPPHTGVTVFPCNYMAAGNFLIYPNPAEGELNVEYLDKKKDSLHDSFEIESGLGGDNFTEVVFQIELYDKQEKLVRTAESMSGKVILDTNNLQPGTYFLQIRTGKEVFRKQVLIK